MKNIIQQFKSLFKNKTKAQKMPVCAKCGRSDSGSGFGGIVDQCNTCGKAICRSCKKRESYHQYCPLCGGSGWSEMH